MPMRHTSADWTDSKGIQHRCEFYQRTASEERHDHLTVGAVVVVDPVNKQKKTRLSRPGVCNQAVPLLA